MRALSVLATTMVALAVLTVVALLAAVSVDVVMGLVRLDGWSPVVGSLVIGGCVGIYVYCSDPRT